MTIQQTLENRSVETLWDFGKSEQVYLYNPITHSSTIVMIGALHFFNSLEILDYRECVGVGIVNESNCTYFGMWIAAMWNIGWIVDVVGQMVLIYPNQNIIDLRQIIFADNKLVMGA